MRDGMVVGIGAAVGVALGLLVVGAARAAPGVSRPCAPAPYATILRLEALKLSFIFTSSPFFALPPSSSLKTHPS